MSVPDKEFVKDRALEERKKKERKKKGMEGYSQVQEMKALSGVFWGDKELGWPISMPRGHTHCLSVSQERAKGAADISA